MSQYAYGLIGRDIKPRRNTHIRRNRFKADYSRWMFPAIFAVISLAIILVGLR